MRVRIQRNDGTKVSYFGVSDFNVNPDHISLHFLRDVNTDAPHREVKGEVVGCVAEAAYNEQGAFETLRGEATDDDSSVIIGATREYPAVSTAGKALTADEGFDGDLELID